MDVSDSAPEVTMVSDKTNGVTKKKCDVTIASASVIISDDNMTSPKPVNGVIDLCDTTNSSENRSEISSVYSTPSEGFENQGRSHVSDQNNKAGSGTNDNQLLSRLKGTSRKETFSTVHTSTPVTTDGNSAVVRKFGVEGSALETPQASPVQAFYTPSSAPTSDHRYQLSSLSNGLFTLLYPHSDSDPIPVVGS